MRVMILLFFTVGASFGYQSLEGTRSEYFEITQLTVDERKEIVAEASPEARTNLWIHHIENYMFTNELDADQIEFLLYSVQLLKGGILNVDKDDLLYDLKVEGPFEGMKDKAKQLFSEEQIVDIFLMMGPFEGDSFNTDPLSGKALPKCKCNKEFSLCWPTKCGGNRRTCLLQPYGCGWLWREACDGLCGG